MVIAVSRNKFSGCEHCGVRLGWLSEEGDGTDGRTDEPDETKLCQCKYSLRADRHNFRHIFKSIFT